MATILQVDLANITEELSKLTTEELKELCNSSTDEKFDEFVNNTTQVCALI